MKQAAFRIGFIWWALGLAIFAGFALGAHVASVIGLGLSMGNWYYPYVQAHGHIQLVGWAGLFIIGISLHFIPRLAGIPVANPKRIDRILGLLAAGLLLRFLAMSLLPYFTESGSHAILSWLAIFSGVLEGVGILLYLVTLLQTINRVPELEKRPALKSVRPFFLMMFGGWLLYPIANLLLLGDMASAGEIILNQSWNELAIQLFINLVLLPVAFAFSVRMFPLYLRLPVIDWSVRAIAICFIIAVALQLIPTLPPLAAVSTHVPLKTSAIGQVLKGGIIFWFIWRLDLLTRRRQPWTVHRIFQPGPERRPTREGLPDYGEFGRFELLVYAAYFWLIVAAAIEVLLGISVLAQWALPVSTDALRHIYLLGFVTHLIFGMAPRMLPGFLKKKQVARPGLVAATFWLGSTAMLSRILPLFIPPALSETLPAIAAAAQVAFGCSGVFGLAAVICLAINLLKTAK